jgi:hypothetical protein
MRLILLILLLFLSFSANAALDPDGCANSGEGLSDAELAAAGYVVVEDPVASAATNTANIQNAVNTAFNQRKAVFFRPDTWTINDSIELMIPKHDTDNINGGTRYSYTLVGSYCGDEKPTIVMADNTHNLTNQQAMDEPVPMFLFWKDDKSKGYIVPPDETRGGQHYNTVIRNLRLETGANTGVVGIRMGGAEGSSIQEIDIDATGGFAGLYNINGSGGYVYRVSVTGGKHGIFNHFLRGGGALVAGLTLSGQEEEPIAHNHYAPLVIVGFDIKHDTGPIYSAVQGSWSNGSGFSVYDGLPANTAGDYQDTGRNSVSFVDGKIEITGESSNFFRSEGPAVHLRNVYLKGETIAVRLVGAGNLNLPDTDNWYRVPEFAGHTGMDGPWNGPGGYHRGVVTDNHWFNGASSPKDTAITLSEQANPPAELQTQHFYDLGICNVEKDGMLFADDYGANPNDSGDDTTEIQAALTAAGDDGAVFLPAVTYSWPPPVGYVLTGTLTLGKNASLCGVSRYSSHLNIMNWTPSVAAQPLIQTVDAADAAPVLADFKIWTERNNDSVQKGWNNHAYAINWQSGEGVYRDVHVMSSDKVEYNWGGPPGIRKQFWIIDNGGGKVFGMTNADGWDPGQMHSATYLTDPADAYPKDDMRYLDRDNDPVMDTSGRYVYVDGTTNPLTFYGFHCQYTQPYQGAMCEINGASNVTLFAGKSELFDDEEKYLKYYQNNNNAHTSAILQIVDSTDITYIGAEGIYEPGNNRGAVEVLGTSSDVLIANIGKARKKKTDRNTATQFFVKEGAVNAGVRFDSHNVIYASTTGDHIVPALPSAPTGPGVPTDFTLKVAVAQ